MDGSEEFCLVLWGKNVEGVAFVFCFWRDVKVIVLLLVESSVAEQHKESVGLEPLDFLRGGDVLFGFLVGVRETGSGVVFWCCFVEVALLAERVFLGADFVRWHACFYERLREFLESVADVFGGSLIRRDALPKAFLCFFGCPASCCL